LAGVVTGLVDQVASLASLVPYGATVTGILHYIASGAIGTLAFKGGLMTALLGLIVQCSLTTAMAGVFVAISRRYPVLCRRPWPSGIAYGVVAFVVMNYLAVPLSAAPNWKPPAGWTLVQSLMGHCFYVGVPIAFIGRALLTRPAEGSQVPEEGFRARDAYAP
jgi:hypothetical protein